MGIDPARDIEAVILTHLHHDHTGGLNHLPHTPVIAPRANWAAATGPLGKIMGYLPQRWPIWLKPNLVEPDGPALGSFAGTHPITRDGRIVLVPTPGHCPGHMSVIVRDDDVTYFLAGDAAYNQANLLAERPDGVTNDPAQAIATFRAIKRFAASEPIIFLPAHDPDGARRLAERSLLA